MDSNARTKWQSLQEMKAPKLSSHNETSQETARTEVSIMWAGIGLHLHLELSTQQTRSRMLAENERTWFAKVADSGLAVCYVDISHSSVNHVLGAYPLRLEKFHFEETSYTL